MQSLMEKEIFEIPKSIASCIDYNQGIFDDIKRCIDEKSIKFIMIAARGTSDHAGEYFKYIVESQIGLPVILAAPSITTMYHSQYKLADALVVGISQSGMAADVIEVIENGNKSGALTIGITNNLYSNLAKAAQKHLYCNCGEEKSVAATKTFVSQLTLLAKLACVLKGQCNIEDELQKAAQDIEEILNKKDEIYEIAKSFASMESCFTLSRGYNYPIAKESALKLQECTYVEAKSYSTSDFMHGPIAMIDDESNCFIYSNEDRFTEELVAGAKKIKEYGARVIVFSNNRDLLEIGDVSIEVTGASIDMISPFYMAVAIQLFACGLAKAKGINPDKPRHLKKVTITK